MMNCPYCNEYFDDYHKHMAEKHPITCKEAQEKFSDYTAGKLYDETDERVICHLTDCESCMDALSKFQAKQVRNVGATS